MYKFVGFGDRFKGLRENTGLSRRSLAEELKVSEMTVRRLEAEDSNPQSDLVIAIANYFECDLQWLLVGETSTQSVFEAECVPLFTSVDDLHGGSALPVDWIRYPGLPQNARATLVTCDDMIPTMQVGDVIIFTDEVLGQNDIAVIFDARGKLRVRYFDEYGGGVLRAEKQDYPPIKLDEAVKIIGKVVNAIRPIDI